MFLISSHEQSEGGAYSLLSLSNLSLIEVKVLWVILLCLNNKSMLDSIVSSLLVRSWMEVLSNSSIRLKIASPCCLSEGDPFLYSPSNSLNRDSWRRLVTPVRDSPTSEGCLVLTCLSWLLILAKDCSINLKEVEKHVSESVLSLLELVVILVITASREMYHLEVNLTLLSNYKTRWIFNLKAVNTFF